MDQPHQPPHRLSRRTFLGASAVAGVSAVVATSGTAISRAAPGPDCGLDSDHGTGNYLWEQVKDRTDQTSVGTNIAIVKPAIQPDPARTQYYAVRNGDDVPGAKYDLLLLPTNRIKGIECSYLWKSTQQNLWQPSWVEAEARIKPTSTSPPITLGVNSAEARTENQLHIHLTQVHHATLDDLRSSAHETDLQKWMTTNVTLRVNDRDRNHKKQSDIRRTARFRVVRYSGKLPNLFKTLERLLPTGETMKSQMIGVVGSGTANSYWLLNSTPGLAGGGTGAADYIFGWPAKP